MSEQLKYNPNKQADKHVFFAESTLTSERARTAFHSAAQMRLDSGDGFTSEKFGKLAAKQLTALERVNKFATRNESQLRLTDFDAPADIEDVKDRLGRSTFLPVDDPKFKDYIEKSQTADREYWRSPEGKKLTDDVNHLSYERIQEEYGLSTPDDAKKYFNDKMNDANKVLDELVHTRLAEHKDTLALLNETTLVSSPAKLVRYAMTTSSSPKARRQQYEALRSLTIAELAASIEQKADNTKEHVDEFNSAITETIFADDKEEYVKVYAFYDEQTGEHLWNSHLDKTLTPEQVETFSKSAVLKRKSLYTRDANGTVGRVLTKPRTKDPRSTLNKMVREAESRRKYTGDDVIEPNGIADLGGFMNVVIEAKTNDDQRVKDLISMHRNLAKTHFGVDDNDIEVKDEKSGYTGQSEEHEFRRFRTPEIEEIFVSLVDYLKNDNQYATRDKKTGEITFNGPAHLLYEKTRWIPVAQRLFPEEIYPPVAWDKTQEDSIKEAVIEIKEENRMPVSELPQEYVVFQPQRTTEPALV